MCGWVRLAKLAVGEGKHAQQSELSREVLLRLYLVSWLLVSLFDFHMRVVCLRLRATCL